MVGRSMLGQIHLGTEFGGRLRDLALRPDVHSFVEVGTWNGNGSTTCFMAGLMARTDEWTLTSYETNQEWHDTAVARWKGVEPERLRLVHGRIGNRIMSMRDIETHPLVQPAWREWYEGEFRDFEAAPLVSLPPVVDCVLLDGGEFTTCGDWDAVKAAGPRIVALDDTRSIKCVDIAAELHADPEWALLDQGDERTGWAIFTHV